MPKIDITKTELVWPGKYNEDGTLKEVPRVSLPFQVIETVNESRATREARKTKGLSLFDAYEGAAWETSSMASDRQDREGAPNNSLQLTALRA